MPLRHHDDGHRLIVERRLLLDTVRQITSVPQQSDTLSIRTSSDGITIVSEMSEITVSATIPCFAEPGAPFSIGARRLLDVLRTGGGAEIVATATGDTLHAQIGPTRYQLRIGVPTLEPLRPPTGGVVVDRKPLLDALGRVLALGDDNAGFATSGIRLTAAGHDLRLDVHESHHAITDTVPGLAEMLGQPAVTITSNTMTDLTRLFPSGVGQLRITGDPDHGIWFAGTTDHGVHIVTTTPHEATLAKDADPWIDAPHAAELRTRPRALRPILERAALVLANGGHPFLHFRVHDRGSTAEISMDDRSLRYRDELACSWDGPDSHFALHLWHLAGATRSLNSEIRLQVHPGGVPIIVTDGSPYRCMLLPLGPDWNEPPARQHVAPRT